MSAKLFEEFRNNLAIQNAGEISLRYSKITKQLNQKYWDSESDTTHCLQVGSYGRHTAINGVSDLDMVFELPWEVHDRFKNREGNVQSQLLQEVKGELQKLYPTTSLKGDGQVVVVQFTNHRIEVLPAFVEKDGAYKYANSNDGGSWNWCRPKEEISAVQVVHARSNSNLKRICKMLRAWKNHCGAPLGGMLIDTLAYNFFNSNTSYDAKSYGSYPEAMRDMFSHFANQDKDQEFWLAPGSASRVYKQGNFQRKAKKAAQKCQEALDSGSSAKKEMLWREVFGRRFPASVTAVAKSARGVRQTEEFIEDIFLGGEKILLDVVYDLRIDCEVNTLQGAAEGHLRSMRKFFNWLPLGRKLRFYVAEGSVPAPCTAYWKIRNVGTVAENRDCIRGQIVLDDGKFQKYETADFNGPHYVECYIVKDGVCVARDRISVPLGGEA